MNHTFTYCDVNIWTGQSQYYVFEMRLSMNFLSQNLNIYKSEHLFFAIKL